MLRCHTEGAAAFFSPFGRQQTREMAYSNVSVPAPLISGLNMPWYDDAPKTSEHPQFRLIKSYSAMAKDARHCSSHAFDWPSRKIAAWDVRTCPYLFSTEAKRSGRAERSGEGGFGGLPRLRQSNSRPRRRRPCRAQRPGRALRRRGVRGPPPTTAQHSTPTRRGKQSAAARPSAAEKGIRGSPPTTAF
jgi:hypothetical protein